MSTTRAVRILYALFVLDLAVIAWQDIKANSSPIGWPEPSRFIRLGVVFTLLSVFADVVSAQLAAVIGGGVSLGLVIHAFQNQAQSTTSAVSTQTQPLPTQGTGLTTGIQV